MATQREQSKLNWKSNDTIEDINSGSLQRIADATEIMAQNFIQLQNDRDMYKRWYNQQCEKNHNLEKRISSFKGVITKLKNKQLNK